MFSIDIDDDLVDLARARLAAIGHRPTLVGTDGAHGLPDHAPYDRIVATCSVPAIPTAWISQTRDGGLILADVKLSVHAGNLVTLHRHADRAEGRIHPAWAGFMALRHTAADTTPPPSHLARDRTHARQRTSDLDQIRPWDNLVAWFLAQLSVPTEIGYGHILDEDRQTRQRPARQQRRLLVRSRNTPRARHQTSLGDRTHTAWQAVENAHNLWHELGRPGWERFGLTATVDRQWIWLDTPDSHHT